VPGAKHRVYDMLKFDQEMPGEGVRAGIENESFHQRKLRLMGLAASGGAGGGKLVVGAAAAAGGAGEEEFYDDSPAMWQPPLAAEETDLVMVWKKQVFFSLFWKVSYSS